MSVAVTNSPVFSPPSSRFLNIPRSSASLTPTSHFNSTRSPSSSSSSSCYSPSSPRSPSLRLRLAAATQTAAIPSSSSGGGSGAAVSKRKRPARLDIPVAAMGFGGPANLAAAEMAEVEREGDGYSVFCKRGRREAMEDRFSAVVGIHGDPKQAFFGVFDGHSGAKAAEFAAENLDKNIVKRLSAGEEEMEEAIKRGYLETDSQFLKQESRGGSCCVTAVIRKGELVVSNAGDCRAVVSRGGGVAEALTSDHRPSRDDERRRIEAQGGYVDLVHGTWRIQGSLAVSRGIGDGHLKQWVIPEPETRTLRISPALEFLILASDGLWDKVSNQEAVDVVRSLESQQQPPLMACKKLVQIAASRGSSDDISVMIVQLGRYV